MTKIAIFLLSAAALGYQLLLMRLLSIIQWHHFAAMIISTALLGYGASGTFLTFTRRRLEKRFAFWFSFFAALFLLTAVAAYLGGQRLPFNPLELPWDWRQVLILAGMDLLFAVPFFCAATAIGLAFARSHGRIAGLYRADLAGAGVGAIAMILLLAKVVPPAMQISPYKPLAQTLRVPGARVAAEKPSSLGLVSVVESPRVPLRFAPGLSLNYSGDLPEQVGVFIDAGAPSVIQRRDSADLDYQDWTTAALPYRLRRPGKVLVVNSRGGSEVLNALRNQVGSIDALEVHPGFMEVVSRDYGEFSGQLYAQPEVQLHVRQLRAFLASTDRKFDLVVDSSEAAPGLPALVENYTYTVEGLSAMIRRLEEDGMVAITRAVNIPPRDTLKIVSTASAALEAMSWTAAEHLMLIRGWNAVTILISRRPFSRIEINRARSFCDERSFDLDFYPGVKPEETNKFNKLDENDFFEGVSALTSSQNGDFLDRYKFNLNPATDNRPYIGHSLRLRTIPELLRMRTRGGAPLLETGYLTLVATAAQALIASAALILLPLMVLRKSHGNWRVFLIFSAIGLAFLFVEIFFIQKLTLLLGKPLVSTAMTLSVFLVFAGLGSGLSRHIRTVLFPAIGIAGLLTLTPLVVPALLGASELAKMGGALALMAPMAVLMGMPFPLAMAAAGEKNPDWVPWAWAVNGCASVLSPVLATVLAIHLGFLAVALGAALLYLLAGVLAR